MRSLKRRSDFADFQVDEKKLGYHFDQTHFPSSSRNLTEISEFLNKKNKKKRGGIVVSGFTPIKVAAHYLGHIHNPKSHSTTPTHNTAREKSEKDEKKERKRNILVLTRVAPNQLHLGSEFMTSPWQHRGNKQQCLDRSRYLPSAQTEPPPPGSFRKEVSAAAKCRVNRAGRGWPLALVRSDQHLHPSLIKR